MSDGIKVDYSTLNECIEGLKTITVQVGGDEITKLIASLDNVFSETNSDTANKLHSVKEKYNTVNNSLVAIARNGIDVLELAMKAYEDADANMQSQIDASSGAGAPDGSGYVTGGGGRYSGGLVKVDSPDAAADALAVRIGGESRVKFANDPDGREFDVVSSEYIAQAKPDLSIYGKSWRKQTKATFEAAQETGRKAYFQFEGQPDDSIIQKIAEYGERYGVEYVIDTTPLGVKN